MVRTVADYGSVRRLAVAALLVAAPAHAQQSAKTCATAFEESSVLMKTGKLRAARDALVLCSSEQCPPAMRPLCDDDLRAIGPRIPTIVLGAKDRRGMDLTNVRVALDGAPLANMLDGRAIEVDPGS